MKTFYFKLTVVFAALQLVGCGDLCPSKYALELPKPPESWISILGEPCWRIEWINGEGTAQTAELTAGSNMEIELTVTCTNPVIAWPYWSKHNLAPGIFMPAGALFPFDVVNNSLRLSWEAGHDVVFYRELALAADIDKKPTKIPANFDWSRFRELFQSDVLSEAVRNDPWLVNWRSAAEKTISGNFDRRRLVPEKTKSMNIPVSSGPWFGTSPFTKPLSFANNRVVIFPVRSGFNLWISAEGILQVNGNNWTFTKMKY